MRKFAFKAIALAALVGWFTQAKADDILNVLTTDGQSIDNTIESVARITFGETAMTIITATSEVDIPYAEIQRITFDLGASGLQTLAADRQMKVSYADSHLYVSGADGPMDVAVFSINGTVAFSNPACTDTEIDVSRLASGIYIAKINKAVVKFIKQ